MATGVSVWVPLGVAAVGLAGVIAAQLIAAWREDLRWRRDRERHEADRLFAARQESYAKLLGAIEYWDHVLYPMVKGQTAERSSTQPDQQRLQDAADEAIRAIGLVVLVAPENVRHRIRDITIPRLRITRRLASEELESREVDQLWATSQANYRTLRALMRTDLGLDAEHAYLQRAGHPHAPPQTAADNPEPGHPHDS
ncbi:hypothetical protein [Nocardia wallacei]|uniref:hypothetical protein n=1 Tax=Nocardia wallacei TaxID=480035 RepID=UPI00245855DA|nr:hypothetical protein [Nocardia wallacei]